MRTAVLNGKEYRYIGTFIGEQEANRQASVYCGLGHTTKLVKVQTKNTYADNRWPAYNLFIN